MVSPMTIFFDICLSFFLQFGMITTIGGMCFHFPLVLTFRDIKSMEGYILLSVLLVSALAFP